MQPNTNMTGTIGAIQINAVWCHDVQFVIDKELGTLVYRSKEFVGFMIWDGFDTEDGIISTSQGETKLLGGTTEWRKVKNLLAQVEFGVYGKTACTA